MSDQRSDQSNELLRSKLAQPTHGGADDTKESDSILGASTSGSEAPMPKMGKAEMGALHIRVIALENLVIALLADASDKQLEMARNMARYIAPREGSTNHPLTDHAAAHMTHLAERAERFGSGAVPQAGDID